jgi:myo-inositol 2-dehydrogenase/D-chiro-inositol 1-dehydrogenase
MNQFARVVDTVLFLLGACDSITATGWPRGENPTERLAVIATSPAGAAEIDIDLDPGTHIRASLSLLMDHNKIICTWIDDFGGPSKLDAAADAGPLVYDAWDGRRALLDAFDLAHRGQASDVPLLQDGIRAMDLTEGVRRSLRRGRTVAVLNEDMGELSGFKSNMASLGCCVILLSLTLYLISRVGLALGIAPLGYLAWLIVPMLVLFGLLQFLRLAARPAKQSGGPKSPAS